MSSPRESDGASSSESKRKAVDPSEHPNISDGRGKANEADKDKDKDKEDAEPISEENAVKPPNPAASSNEASSSKSKRKAVDPAEHPNIGDGRGNVDKDDKDEEKVDAELVNEEIMHNVVKPMNPRRPPRRRTLSGCPERSLTRGEVLYRLYIHS